MENQNRKWPRVLIVVASSLVLIPAAAIANGKAMWNLATFSGWDDFTALLLPLSLDGLAALSVYMWRKGRTHAARTFGRAVTLLAMVASVVVAALGHMSTAGMLVATVPLVVGVGAIPALSLVALVELLVLDAGVEVGRKARKGKTPQTVSTPAERKDTSPAERKDTSPAERKDTSPAERKDTSPAERTDDVVPVSPGPKPAVKSQIIRGESVPGPEERVREAMQALNGSATNAKITAWSKAQYGVGVSPNKITEVRTAMKA